jgi:hypothetical protein
VTTTTTPGPAPRRREDDDGGRTGDGLRVGLFGIGLDTYWPQFAGLEERLRGYLARTGCSGPVSRS